MPTQEEIIRRMMGGTPAPSQALTSGELQAQRRTQAETLRPKPAPAPAPSPVQRPTPAPDFGPVAGPLVATGELATTLATGIVAFPLSGWSGLNAMAGGLFNQIRERGIKNVNMDEILNRATEVMEHTAQTITIPPITERGQEAVSLALKPIEWIQQGAKSVGDYVLEKTGNPNTAAIYATATEALGLAVLGRIGAGIKGTIVGKGAPTPPSIPPAKAIKMVLEATEAGIREQMGVKKPKVKVEKVGKRKLTDKEGKIIGEKEGRKIKVEKLKREVQAEAIKKKQKPTEVTVEKKVDIGVQVKFDGMTKGKPAYVDIDPKSPTHRVRFLAEDKTPNAVSSAFKKMQESRADKKVKAGLKVEFKEASKEALLKARKKVIKSETGKVTEKIDITKKKVKIEQVKSKLRKKAVKEIKIERETKLQRAKKIVAESKKLPKLEKPRTEKLKKMGARIETKGFQDLEPGTHEWAQYWRKHPEEQGAMLELAKRIKEKEDRFIIAHKQSTAKVKVEKVSRQDETKLTGKETPAKLKILRERKAELIKEAAKKKKEKSQIKDENIRKLLGFEKKKTREADITRRAEEELLDLEEKRTGIKLTEEGKKTREDLLDDPDFEPLGPEAGAVRPEVFLEGMRKISREALKAGKKLRPYMIENKKIPPSITDKAINEFNKINQKFFDEVDRDVDRLITAKEKLIKENRIKKLEAQLKKKPGKTVKAVPKIKTELPEFTSTEQALEFAKKATPKHVKEAERIRDAYGRISKKLLEEKKYDESLKAAVKGQFYREMIEARKPPKGPTTFNSDLMGTQTAVELAAKYVKAVKEWKSGKRRPKEIDVQVKKMSDQYLIPEVNNPLSQAASAGLRAKAGDAWQAFYDALPSLGKLTPKEVLKASPGLKRIIAKRRNKPILARSGFFVTTKFKAALRDIKGDKDILPIDVYTSPPSMAAYAMQGGKTHGPVTRQMIWPVRNMVRFKNNWITSEKVKFSNILDKYKIRGRKKLELVTDMVELTSPKATVNSLRRTQKAQKILKGLSQTERNDILNTAIETKNTFVDAWKKQNLVRKKQGRRMIPFRNFYAPRVFADSVGSRLFGLREKPAHYIEKPSPPDFLRVRKNAPFNAREMARNEGLGHLEKERRISTLMSMYLDTAGKDMFDTSIIQHLKVYADALEGSGRKHGAKWTREWASEVFAGSRTHAESFALAVLRRQGRAGLLTLRRVLARNVFPLNFRWNFTTQLASVGITYTRQGPGPTIKGLKVFTDSKLKKFIQENAYAYITKTKKSGGVSFQDIDISPTAVKGLDATKFETAVDYANWLTSTFEEMTSRHAAGAAYFRGRQLKLEGKDLAEYVSDGVETQTVYNLMESPPLMRSKSLGALTPFQKFGFTVFNTLREMKTPIFKQVFGKTGASESIAANSIEGKALINRRLRMFGRAVMAVYITNTASEAITGAPIWKWSAPFPIASVFINAFSNLTGSDTRRGVMPDQYISEFINAFKAVVVYENWDKFRKWAITYNPVGSGIAINRIVDTLVAENRGGIVKDVRGRKVFRLSLTPNEIAKSFILGPYGTEAGKELQRKKKKKGLTQWLRLKKEFEESKRKKGKGIGGIGGL